MSWLLGAFITGLAGLGTMIASTQRRERWLNWLSWIFYMGAYWLLVYAFFEIGYSVAYGLWAGGTAVFFAIIASFTLEKRPSLLRVVSIVAATLGLIGLLIL
ncbi:MAG: SMR family transporter [Chloroflexota bacterium]